MNYYVIKIKIVIKIYIFREEIEYFIKKDKKLNRKNYQI